MQNFKYHIFLCDNIQIPGNFKAVASRSHGKTTVSRPIQKWNLKNQESCARKKGKEKKEKGKTTIGNKLEYRKQYSRTRVNRIH